MIAYEYLVLEPIPDIGARTGDVLVWDYPTVALVRARRRGRSNVDLITMHPQHWVYVFMKYEDRLTPFDPDAPPVVALAETAVGSGSPLPAPAAPTPPRHLRLVRP